MRDILEEELSDSEHDSDDDDDSSKDEDSDGGEEEEIVDFAGEYESDEYHQDESEDSDIGYESDLFWKHVKNNIVFNMFTHRLCWIQDKFQDIF